MTGKLSLRLFALLLVAALFAAGCQKEPSPVAYTDRQWLMLDTTDNHTPNNDSLIALVHRYERTGNRQAEMAALAELGHSYQTASRYTHAIRAHRRQLQLARSLGDTLMMASALNDLGVNFRRMGLYYDGLNHHQQAIDMSRGGTGELRRKLLKCQAIGFNGLGNVYLTIGHYRLADSTLRRALAIETSLGSHLGMNVDCSNIGMVYERRGLVDSAWLYFRRAYHHSRLARSATGQAYCHMNFGRLYQQAGQYDSAAIEFSTAMRLVPGERDLWLWLQPCIAMAGLQVEMHRFDDARHYLDRALTTAQRVGAREYYARLYRLYSDFYHLQGDYRRALDSYQRATAAADSLMNTNSLFEIEELQNEITQRALNERMTAVHRQLSTERTSKYIFALALLVALILVGALWYTAHVRKQAVRAQRQFQQARNRFFTNVTHEFRTPLTLILGLGEQIAAGSDATAESRQAAGATIVKQGRQLLSLVGQLLDISKVRSTVIPPAWRTGNVVPYLHTMVESGELLARAKSVSLHFLPRETEIVVDTEPDYLCKIMRNLISNAVKFTPAYGTVSVSCGRRGDSLFISVTDTGVGIPPESLPHIFEPFYQAQSDSSNLGTGVGLALVHQLVEAMHGTISVESTPGQGTTFLLLMPLKQGHGSWPPFSAVEGGAEDMVSRADSPDAPDPLPAPDEETASPPAATGTPGQAPTVLIVDDNADVTRFIASQLPSTYRLCYAADGAEGLQKTISLKPDLVVTDLMMPVMDGLEMCRRIRADRSVSTTPIIVVTAKVLQADLEEGLRAGANAYLFKPFSASELRIRVEWILTERRMLHEKFLLASQLAGEAPAPLSADDRALVTALSNAVYDQLRHTEIDLDDLAARLCMSRRTLQRKVSALSGLSLTAYITKIRIDYARQLLRRRPELSVGEVALASGFSDRSYFDRMFKQAYDMTPAQFRRVPAAPVEGPTDAL